MQYKLSDFDRIRKEKILNLNGSYYYVKLKITLCKWWAEDNRKQLFSIRTMEDILNIPKASLSRHILTLYDELFLSKVGEGRHCKYFMNITKEEAGEIINLYLEKQNSRKRNFLKSVEQQERPFKKTW